MWMIFGVLRGGIGGGGGSGSFIEESSIGCRRPTFQRPKAMCSKDGNQEQGNGCSYPGHFYRLFALLSTLSDAALQRLCFVVQTACFN
jgi:hypothetical protein